MTLCQHQHQHQSQYKHQLQHQHQHQHQHQSQVARRRLRRWALFTVLAMLGMWFCLPSLVAAQQVAALEAASGSAPVSLVFAGDIVLDDDAGRLIAKGGDPFASFAPLFKSADIRIGNLECVIATVGTAGNKNFTFRAHPRVVPTLKKHFDAVALANNHSGDYGPEAFAQMLDVLQQGQVGYFGGGRNLRQAHTPWIVERRGLRIALLGYNEFMPRSFEADHHYPGIAWSEDEQVVADIRKARTTYGAHLVIPVMHWGWENEPRSNARQQQLARLMIDAGADAVLGGHPHVTQELEIYQGKPIVYSVGNFVMKETDNDAQRVGWVVRLFLDSKGVVSLDTQVAHISMAGIPRWRRDLAGPKWQSQRR